MAGGITLPQPDPTNKMEVWSHATAKLTSKTYDWTVNIAELSVDHKKKTQKVEKSVKDSKEGDPSLASIDKKLDEGNTQSKKQHEEEQATLKDQYEHLMGNVGDWFSNLGAGIGKALTNDTASGLSQMKKGWAQIFNGLGEFGPMVSMVKDVFHKVRGVFDILIGFTRGIVGFFVKIFKGLYNVVSGGTEGGMFGFKNKEQRDAEEKEREEKEEEGKPNEVDPLPLPVLVAGYTDQHKLYENAFNEEEKDRHNEQMLVDQYGNKLEKESLKEEKEQGKTLKKIHKRQWLQFMMMFGKLALVIGGIMAIWNWLTGKGSDNTTTPLDATAIGISRGLAKELSRPSARVAVERANAKVNVDNLKKIPLVETQTRKSPILGADGKPVPLKDNFKWTSAIEAELGPKPVGWDELGPEEQKKIFEQKKQEMIKKKSQIKISAYDKAVGKMGTGFNAIALGYAGYEALQTTLNEMDEVERIRWFHKTKTPILMPDGTEMMVDDELMSLVERESAAILAGDYTGLVASLTAGGSAWAAVFKELNPMERNAKGNIKWLKSGVNLVNPFKKVKVVWKGGKATAISVVSYGVADELGTRAASLVLDGKFVNPSDTVLGFMDKEGWAGQMLDLINMPSNEIDWKETLGEASWSQYINDYMLPLITENEELNEFYFNKLEDDTERATFLNEIMTMSIDNSAQVDNSFIIQSMQDQYHDWTLDNLQD